MHQPKQKSFAPIISLQNLSQRSNSLSTLLAQANARLSLDDIIEQCLPDKFKGHFKVNNLVTDTLVLTCHSAKLMTQFRFIESDVMDKVNRLISPKKIQTIKIKIRPNSLSTTETPNEKVTHRSISKKNAQILLQEAEHTEDKKLRNSLIKLATHAT